MTPKEIYRMRSEVLKLSQEQFARLLDVSVKTVSRWEKGEASPTGLYEEKLLKLREIINNQNLLNSLNLIMGGSLGLFGASMFIGGISNILFLAKAGYSEKILDTLSKLLDNKNN
ncbi:MAG: helix-turn-helix domain-containing protein [Ignavibacterium sp.]|nr:helix-turn-helix domain-containing protein [Ignavibacterium sp.]MDW8375870.1 helix-turn-helix domain-containing protein [Ignavibacteriales bacterium]